MRARNKLNVLRVATLTKPAVYSDGGGLYLRIRSCGSKTWLFIGMLRGRRREMGLGSVQDISLAKAREKAAEARELILDGKDPVQERARKIEAERPQVTFGAFAMKLVDDIEDGFRNTKHRQQWRNTLTEYAAPLFDMLIDEIETEHVLAVIQPIWLSKNETASRVRGRIERVLDAARAKGLRKGENPARARGHLELLLPKRSRAAVRHHPALPFKQMPVFIAELRQRSAMAARALEFVILTAARSGEVRGMTWGEIDLAAKLWTVPAERMKAGALHEVPLSDRAIEILKAAAPAIVKADRLVFPADRGGSLSDMALTALLRRMDRGDITAHGFRSAFRDWAGEVTSFAREEIEMALAHTIESSTERAYRRGRALDKRRALMEAWATHCRPG